MANSSFVSHEIRFRGDDCTPGLRAFATSAIQTAFSRFERRIAGITVTIDDVNGPRGGRDKFCRIEVRLSRGGSIIGRAVAENEYAAIAKARLRARTKLLRSLTRPATVSRTARRRVNQRRISVA
ncbi:MAG TPA: HPF/RaiA family ribosome-associated protein [Caulifigura sp.]|jgi:hypothetical protein|nr:HPF/RaiA family ribosome-associated protein [Caulifigura sp.]